MQTARRMKRSLTILVVLCAAQPAAMLSTGGALAASPALPSRHASPSRLILNASDVHQATGDKFSGGSSVVTNTAVAAIEGVSVATMNRYRVGGNSSSFFRSAGRGVKVIADSVGLYKSPAAATWQYKLFTGESKPPRGSKTISMKGIGDQERGYSTATGASVYFRRGVYTARIDILGIGVALAPVILRLSRILDGRMRKG